MNQRTSPVNLDNLTPEQISELETKGVPALLELIPSSPSQYEIDFPIPDSAYLSQKKVCIIFFHCYVLPSNLCNRHLLKLIK